MNKAIIALSAFIAAAPAHAVSIVCLHTGATCPSAFSTGPVGTAVLLAGVAALAAVVLLRIYKRGSKHS